jgi:superfamily II DNA or RNA helicase
MSAISQPDLDISADAARVRAVVHAERLAYGHLANSAFATETALIDPLPHQRIAVYQRMLPQPRLRFLLADDAGAGKTIMAGLYIREMLTRRLIQRVLIIPPAGLVTNWQRELRTLFSLSFGIVTGSNARTENPFDGPDSDHLIVSVDTLAGERVFDRLQEPSVTPYDLVIFDEAHKLSADRDKDFSLRTTGRYRLAEALAGIRTDNDRWQLPWGCHHLLLLTATPHMGKDFPYYALWRLLEPDMLSTIEAFHDHPPDARQRCFIRRTKEEMVTLDGRPLYPPRVSDTLSYTLVQGPVSEQALYEQTTAYLETTYNLAHLLNRQAARFAMSIFQRRLASSTWALLCSLERRLAKLNDLITAIESGQLTDEHLTASQQRLAGLDDPFETTTADEDTADDGYEAHEAVEAAMLGSVVAESLPDLYTERDAVHALYDLAYQVDASGQESKFTRLRDFLCDPAYDGEKVIIFTEHRDTLNFLVRRLKGIGLDGKIAAIHGGLNAAERDEQVSFFRAPVEQGGALYLVATDAAGEGINLQFCWLMVNYDLPWNPARLEQRMGRIHRYGQKHSPVVIVNIVAGTTREGRVMRTLLAKLEAIRKELGTDKVFDVIGRLFEGESLTDYMREALTEPGTEGVMHRLEGKLTAEQVAALSAKEQRLYGDGGDVKAQLGTMQADLDHEMLRRMLPGSVRRFLEQSAPLVGIAPDGDLDGVFALKATTPGALDPFLPVLDAYPPAQRGRFSVERPQREERDTTIFLRPGEPFFDCLWSLVRERFRADALRGGMFIDPTASTPYLLHIATITVVRRGDQTFPTLAREVVREARLVGARQEADGTVVLCPVEALLLLKETSPETRNPEIIRLIARAKALRTEALVYLRDHIAHVLAEEHRSSLLATLPERLHFLKHGHKSQEAELAKARSDYNTKARLGDPRAKGEITRIRQRQIEIDVRHEIACMLAQREPELIAVGEVTWVAHALVIPSSDPEEQQRHDAAVEALAMQVARAYEEARGVEVRDVSKAEGARAAELEDHPGFDLLSLHPEGERRSIEVKGRAGRGAVELTENEWVKACNLREGYWLYVVYDCASAHPMLLRVQDPFGKLIVHEKSSVVIGEQAIVGAAE